MPPARSPTDAGREDLRGPTDRPWCARAQPQGRLPRPAPRRPDRVHRAVRVGQVQPGLRHDLRRGPAPLRRVAVGLRPPVPRPDGQARRRLHRGPLARRSRSTRSRPAATRGRRSARSPRSTTTCGCCSPAPAGRTARSAASRSAGRPRSRSSTGCSSSTRAPGSRCSRRWSGAARASTSSCSASCRPRATAGPGSTARPCRWPSRPSSTRSTSTRSRSSSTGSRSSRRAKRRLTDSVETALGLAGGLVILDFVDLPENDPDRERRFSEQLACPNDHPLSIDELEPRSFSFNSPFGACPECTGLGTRLEVDPELIVPDDEMSLAEGAVAPWAAGASSSEYFQRLLEALAEDLELRHRHAVAQAAGPGARTRSCTASTTRCTSGTGTATAGCAATTPASRA